jgi:hypothetical protein
LMEGLRLLDESSREGGAEPEPGASPVASAPAPSAPPPSAPSLPPGTGGSARKEEEEDVLLDG